MLKRNMAGHGSLPVKLSCSVEIDHVEQGITCVLDQQLPLFPS